MIKRYCLFIFLLLHTGLKAQQHLFSNERIAGVLPSHECYNIYQDSRGYIWFSTEGGLCRFNGNTIEVYNEQNGFPEKSCYGICESSNGKLWFISSKSRVLFYDEKQDRIFEASFSKEINKQMSNRTDQIYLIKAINDSTLLFCSKLNMFRVNIFSDEVKRVGANTDSVYYFKKENNSLLFITPEFKKLSKEKVSIGIISKDTLKVIVKWENNIPPQWRCVTAVNSLGESFIGWDNMLIKINIHNQVETYKTPGNVLDIYIDKSNGLWVGVLKGGVMHFENGNLSKPVVSLNGISVTGICEDHEKGIWCSTLERGIYYCKDERMVSYADLYGINKTEELLKPVNGNLFCYANNKDLIRISKNDITIHNYIIPNGNGISDIVSYKNGYLVVNAGGINFTDTAFKKPLFIKDKNSHFIRGAIKISNPVAGRIFMIQYETLLGLDKNDNIFVASLLKSGANCLCEVNNDLYLGCKDGLYKISLNNFAEEKIGNITDKVSDIVMSGMGDLWIAMREKGLYILKNGVLKNITDNNALKNIRFFDLCNDGEGHIWAASNSGVIKIDEHKPGSFTIFSTDNGLPSSQVNKVCAFNGKIYVSTVEGLCSFPINEDLTNATVPAIYLNTLYINNTAYTPQGDVVQTTYDKNNLKFVFDVLTFKNADTKLFYQLKGTDNLLEGNSTNELLLSNMVPGVYELSVYGVNNCGVKSKIPFTLKLIIEKSFWRTGWFLIFCFLILMLLVFVIAKIIIVRIRKKEEAKTKINKMLAEYQLTALQAQMNPHFISNAINSIQGYVLKKDEQLAYDYLSKFSKLIRMVLNHSQEKLLPLKQELELLQLYIELEQLRFDDSFDYNLHIGEDVNVFEILIPSMLIQPYVENAIKHGLMNLDKNKKGILSIFIALYGEGLKITIEDNGIGRELAKTFEKETGHKSVGLKLTEQRLTMISTLQNYESAKVLVTDLYDEQGIAAGTKVEIYLPI